MRKVISLMHLSLDGFAANAKGEMDWIVLDDAIFEDVDRLTDSVDTAIYGRVTYKMMEGYWPTVLSNPESTIHDRHHAQWVENVQKIVISRTLDKVEWNNSSLIKDNIAEEISKLKAQPGKEIMIFGSPRVANLLAQLDLVDEYRLTISPVVLGSGIPMFDEVKSQLKLLSAKPYNAGTIALHYEVVR
jgi:dihydrofolate reductase